MSVFLVGAGPGDPELITVKGKQLLQECDVVVYDRLAPRELLAFTKAGCELIDVGKRPTISENDQDYINNLLIERARLGLTVVRLKGGDPCVFGRGGEEAQALMNAGIDFQIVPGVTSAIAVPAYAGIPVTHRNIADSVTIVTGHQDSKVNWKALAELGTTIVVLMGVTNRKEISRKLIENGMDPATSVAIVEWGTTPEQSTHRTNLEELERARVRPPATIVIGQVAEMNLKWFESRPLLGKRVVVTRASETAGKLSKLVREFGARVIEIPTIRTLELEVPPVSGQYEWTVFTSPIAVELYVKHFRITSKIAAVGPATRNRLNEAGYQVELVPDEFDANSLVESFPIAQNSGQVLYPKSQIAKDTIESGLVSKGWQVTSIDLYTTERVPLSDWQIKEISNCDIIAFASSSAVEALADVLGDTLRSVSGKVVCIGYETARVAESLGARSIVIAKEHSIEGLAKAVLDA